MPKLLKFKFDDKTLKTKFKNHIDTKLQLSKSKDYVLTKL